MKNCWSGEEWQRRPHDLPAQQLRHLGNFLNNSNTQNLNPEYFIGQKKGPEVIGNGITESLNSGKD